MSFAPYITTKTYLPRFNTDELFELPAGSVSYTGEYDRAVRFVAEHQSKNTRLWSVFVEQYKNPIDADNGGWRGEYWGKMMRGAAWVYKYTGDAELYSILENAVLDLLKAQDADGRFSSYVKENEFSYWDMWCRKYVLLGMQYFYDICKSDELKEKIINALCRHLDYIIDRIGEGEGKIDILDATTHNDWTWGALNSSSILEPTVLLYNITDDEKYLDFAAYLVRRGGSKWGNIYELAVAGEKKPYEFPVRKAYEAISYFEGVLEYYRVTGDESAKRAFLNFLDGAIETDFTIIGCAGTYHELFDHSSIMQTEYNDEVKQETCVTVTLMKAFYQALCLTGDAKYADAMELAGYNAMLGSINFNKNTAVATDEAQRLEYKYDEGAEFLRLIEGFTFDSYAPLYKDKRNRRVGGFQLMSGGAYGCCACIGAAGVAVMPLSSIMAAHDGLRINHLMNGTVKFGGIALEIKTEYPYGERADIKITEAVDTPLSIGIRVPEFARGAMTVDGERAESDEYGYAVITKRWVVGDVISVVIPREVSIVELNGKLALKRGVITFALDERNQDINVKLGGNITSVKEIKPDFDVREALEVEFAGETKVLFTDFASAGAQWDKPKNNITVWIDKK